MVRSIDEEVAAEAVGSEGAASGGRLREGHVLHVHRRAAVAG